MQLKVEIIEAMLSSGVLIPAIWLSLALIVVWFLLSAKRVVPLTHTEAETLWKAHRQKERCKSKDWNQILRNQDIIGFECECGKKHIQKKHIITINS